MEKHEYLSSLQQSWANCQGCALSQGRRNVVFGYGCADAQVMIIGEAPGENEDRSGLPFVGSAGILLDQYLGSVSAREEVITLLDTLNSTKGSSQEVERRRNEMRIQLRDFLCQEFYFTNVVMCRPPENRDPIPKEMEACRSRLLEQIYIIDPVMIVAAGRIAAEAVIGKKVAITSSRGEIFDVEFRGRLTTFRYPVMAVLHPAYLLRKNDFRQDGGEGQKTYNDFLRVMRIVDEFNEKHYGMPQPKTRPKMK